MRPIAHLKSPFNEKFGTPRQSLLLSYIPAEIVPTSEFRHRSFYEGLLPDQYIWVFSLFHQASQSKSSKVRPPRLGGNQKRGVFATRSPFRPNGLGLSLVQIKEIQFEEDKVKKFLVHGIDLIDQTPLLDIKPYLPDTESVHLALAPIQGQRPTVKILDWEHLLPDDEEKTLLLYAIPDLIRLGPWPSYHKEDRSYGLNFMNRNIRFEKRGENIQILEIKIQDKSYS